MFASRVKQNAIPVARGRRRDEKKHPPDTRLSSRATQYCVPPRETHLLSAEGPCNGGEDHAAYVQQRRAARVSGDGVLFN